VSEVQPEPSVPSDARSPRPSLMKQGTGLFSQVTRAGCTHIRTAQTCNMRSHVTQTMDERSMLVMPQGNEDFVRARISKLFVFPAIFVLTWLPGAAVATLNTLSLPEPLWLLGLDAAFVGLMGLCNSVAWLIMNAELCELLRSLAHRCCCFAPQRATTAIGLYDVREETYDVENTSMYIKA
jgi:hypothetical protein